MMSGNIFFLIYICSLKKQLSFFFFRFYWVRFSWILHGEMEGGGQCKKHPIVHIKTNDYVSFPPF